MVENDENGLTERQKYWLGHLRSCLEGAGTLKAYAAERGLSLPSLYFWKRQLLADGLLEGGGRSEVRFRRIGGLAAWAAPLAGRVCLPNGVCVEWSAQGEESLQAVLRAAHALP